MANYRRRRVVRAFEGQDSPIGSFGPYGDTSVKTSFSPGALAFQNERELLEQVVALVGAQRLREFATEQLAGDRLTTQEAADILQMSRPTLIKLLERGDIPHSKVGNRRYVSRADIEGYRARIGGQVVEEFPRQPERVVRANLRALLHMAEDERDFDEGRLGAVRRDDTIPDRSPGE